MAYYEVTKAASICLLSYKVRHYARIHPKKLNKKHFVKKDLKCIIQIKKAIIVRL
jgi:nitrate reductase cytochrome c-type subunit